jgi:hypothetical protein
MFWKILLVVAVVFNFVAAIQCLITAAMVPEKRIMFTALAVMNILFLILNIALFFHRIKKQSND